MGLRGHNIFQGYINDSESTEACFKDGWLRTGDQGKLDDGRLFITGRKKDMIITTTGQRISPSYIENLLRAHPLIGDVVVVGDKRKYLTALITLNTDAVAKMAKKKGTDPSHLVIDQDIQMVVQKHVKSVNRAHLPKPQAIKKFTTLPDPFAVARGELTPTLKVRRD